MTDLILYPDGRQGPVSPANGTDYSLAELKAIVEGYIEIVQCRNKAGYILVINEEGRLIDLPRNEEATRLAGLPTREEKAETLAAWASAGFQVIDASIDDDEPYIAGTCLCCKNEEVQ